MPKRPFMSPPVPKVIILNIWPHYDLDADQIWPKSEQFTYDPRRFTGKILPHYDPEC